MWVLSWIDLAFLPRYNVIFSITATRAIHGDSERGLWFCLPNKESAIDPERQGASLSVCFRHRVRDFGDKSLIVGRSKDHDLRIRTRDARHGRGTTFDLF